MEFRNLKRQYEFNKENIDTAIQNVLNSAHFIQGNQVVELEKKLSEYVGVKHCITCANGTDALKLALMTWNIGKGDAVFLPDFTFFATGEAVAAVGAVPVFVDVDVETFNIDVHRLEERIKKVIEEGCYQPKVIIAVDLFGQPADYLEIRKIADEFNLYILEDAAQGFGGAILNKKACSFGDISATSFFPAKPFGCYGDGGAVFTDRDDWMQLIRSYAVHGKGNSKYDNIRIGMNSRLDTIQAAVLLAKFPVYIDNELQESSMFAKVYDEQLKDIVKIPYVKKNYFSCWAQYTIQLKDETERFKVQNYLKKECIPTAVYYPIPMHKQKSLKNMGLQNDCAVSEKLCKKVLSLPLDPYMKHEDINFVVKKVKESLTE